MQTLSEQRQAKHASTQSRMIAFISILLFAFAGLISGFAFGAFLHPGQQAQSPNQGKIITPPAAGQATTTPTPHIQAPGHLGYPVIDHVSSSEVNDDTTVYNLSAHAVDQSIDAGHGKPVHASNITCRLWLTKDFNLNVPADRLRNVSSLQNPFPREIQNALDFFDPTTQQTQLCNAKGRVTWNYKVASSVDPGTYYLEVLMDWDGLYYNWWLQEVTITH